MLRECHVEVEMEDSIEDLTMKSSSLSLSEAVKVVDGAKYDFLQCLGNSNLYIPQVH